MIFASYLYLFKLFKQWTISKNAAYAKLEEQLNVSNVQIQLSFVAEVTYLLIKINTIAQCQQMQLIA